MAGYNCKGCIHNIIKYAPYAHGLIETCDIDLSKMEDSAIMKGKCFKSKNDEYEYQIDKMVKERLN